MHGNPKWKYHTVRAMNRNEMKDFPVASYSWFDQTLRKRLNLRFDATLLRGESVQIVLRIVAGTYLRYMTHWSTWCMAGVMKAFDDTGDGEIDFRKFCELVMGSTKTTPNSLGIGQLPGIAHCRSYLSVTVGVRYAL